MSETIFKIAEAARLVGVAPSTLRLWEQQGLIQPIRTPSGQRLFDAALLERLKTIAWLRSEHGLNPAAIREKLSAAGEDDDTPLLTVSSRPVTPDGIIPIGSKLREIRRRAGRTLADVAAAINLSPSQISTFERTSQGLSLTALHALSRTLGTTVAALSDTEADDTAESLVRAGQWTNLPTTPSGVSVQLLTQGRNQMECHRFHLAPGASSEGSYQHDGEEFIHVLAGRLEIILDGDRFFDLHAGDSFYFDSQRIHSWRNMFDGETVLIWINTPPTF